MNLLFFVVIFLASCSEGTQHKNTSVPIKPMALIKQVDEDSFFNKRTIFKLDGDFVNDKVFLASILHNQGFGEINPSSISKVSLIDKIKIRKFGLAELYKIALNNVPSVIPDTFYLVINKENSIATVLPISFIDHIKLKDNDSSEFIGGVYLVRARGFFLIYDFDQNNFLSILNTAVDSSCNGIPIFNNSYDCISYEPFLLEYSNTDIDKDGINDIEFSGQVNFYCKGLERGSSRSNSKPIETAQLKIQFITKKEGDKVFWVTKDTGFCQMLTR